MLLHRRLARLDILSSGSISLAISSDFADGSTAVATSIGVTIREGTVLAEGDLDFRGTLGVSREVPIGFQRIRLYFDLQTDASDDQLATLLRLTERYCVVYQTLRGSPEINVSHRATTPLQPPGWTARPGIE